MGFLDSVRKAIAGPARVQGEAGEQAEVSAALHEEYSVQSPGEDETKQIEELTEDQTSPVIAAAPFAGTGQIRATEVETELVNAEDVTPDETEIPSEEEGPIDPDA